MAGIDYATRPDPGSLDWLTSERGDRRPARPVSDMEQRALTAFRRLPPDEKNAILSLLLARIRRTRRSDA